MEICIDNGGTLTDICVFDGDNTWTTKTSTTPYDLSQCFFDGLKKISGQMYGEEDVGRLLAESSAIKYSTTQGTNSLVERKGPRLGLLVSKGFDMSRLTQSGHHEELLAALVGDRVAAVDMDVGESELTDEIVRCTNRLGALGASRIVICFTGEDYARQERAYMSRYARCFLPHHLGTVPIGASHETTGDSVEERRMWTTILNAFLHGPMENFLFYAQKRLKTHRGAPTLRVLRNDGGTARVTKTSAVKTYSSGPRGGMEAAFRIADRCGYPHVISLDVGGTTSDIGTVENARIHTDLRGHIEGVESSLELCDIVSVGVGGGSIIRVVDGAIKVGPDSAGAVPGPACFALGGTDATVTDAVLATGFLDPATFFEGGKSLDRTRAENAIKTHIADPLGMTVPQAAHAMRAAWAETAAKGIREHCKPRADSILLAFGGGGPLAICEIAQQLGLNQVFVPKLAAMLSAYGVSFCDVAQDYETEISTTDATTLKQVAEVLLDRARKDMAAEGAALENCQLRARAIKAGQMTEVDIHAPEAWPKAIDSLQLRVSAAKPNGASAASKSKAVQPAPRRTGDPCRSSGERMTVDAEGVESAIPVYRTSDYKTGEWASGPAVLEGHFYTGYLPAQWTFHVIEGGDLLLVHDTNA